MRLIVTRPLAQAEDWVRQLQVLRLDAVALPLIGIAAVDDAAPLRAAWQQLPDATLVVFVSANAVVHFFAQRAAGSAWPAGVLAGSTGPGTSAALRHAGVPASHIEEPATDAPHFDSEALWVGLQHRTWRGRRVWVVRGEDGRDWLAERLLKAGAALDFVAAYRREMPQLSVGQHALLQAAMAEPASYTWLFSSSLAVAHLQALAPGADWHAGMAMASHPRIAQAARDAGFGRVESVAPSARAVADRMASLQARSPSIQSAAQ
jgi:uroporphyrinogen-III synthase